MKLITWNKYKTNKYIPYIFTVALILIASILLMIAQNKGINETLNLSEDELAQAINMDLVPYDSSPMLAIIINDFGQTREGVKEMMELDAHLTFGVIPFLPYSSQDAESALKSGKDTILHISFDDGSIPSSALGPRKITHELSEENVLTIISDALKEIPGAIGISNHLGSINNGYDSVMKNMISYYSKNQVNGSKLIFIDNIPGNQKTSVLSKYSSEYNYTNRIALVDTVLDGKDSTVSSIKNQIKKAARIAEENGFAVAIGHVGAEGGVRTAEAIKSMLSWLGEKNIKLVTLSELVG